MTKDRARQWLALVADLAVVAGIIFLAVEIRQNTEAVVASSSRALTDQSVEFFAAGLDNQIVARAVYKQGVGEDLDGFETAQLSRLQYLNFRVFENAYLQYRRGYYDETEWERYRRIITRNLRDPIVRAMWDENRGVGFTAEFERMVDALDTGG
jgi:hypothetical protein